MDISRKWTRRETEKSEPGEVGIASLTVPDGDWKLVVQTVGKDKIVATLPAITVTNFIEQALSPLTDSLAGNHKIVDARESFYAKALRLAKGEIGTRGGGVSDVHVEIRSIVRAKLRAAKPDEWKALQDMSSADANAFLDAKIEAQSKPAREMLEQLAAENIAERQKAREAKAAREAGAKLKL